MCCGFLERIWVFWLIWVCSSILTCTKMQLFKFFKKMSYLLDSQGVRDMIFKFYCSMFGQKDIMVYSCKYMIYSNQICVSRSIKVFIQQLRRFKNGRVFTGMDSCLTIITNFEQNFQFLFPYFENFTSFIFYYKILE